MSKYLTYDEKLEMEAGLKADLSFGAIGKIISKDRTTVAKEIKRNLIVKKTGYGAYPYNACKLRLKCTRTKICDECIYPSKPYCKNCKICNDGCPYFEEDVCVNKFRPRYKKSEFKIDKKCRIGRTYKNFTDFMNKYQSVV